MLAAQASRQKISERLVSHELLIGAAEEPRRRSYAIRAAHMLSDRRAVN